MPQWCPCLCGLPGRINDCFLCYIEIEREFSTRPTSTKINVHLIVETNVMTWTSKVMKSLPVQDDRRLRRLLISYKLSNGCLAYFFLLSTLLSFLFLFSSLPFFFVSSSLLLPSSLFYCIKRVHFHQYFYANKSKRMNPAKKHYFILLPFFTLYYVIAQRNRLLRF